MTKYFSPLKSDEKPDNNNVDSSKTKTVKVAHTNKNDYNDNDDSSKIKTVKAPHKHTNMVDRNNRKSNDIKKLSNKFTISL